MSSAAQENQQVTTPVAPKLDAIHETQETASTVEPKPEDLAPHARVVVHTDVPYAPRCRFFPGKAKEVIGAILKEKLTGVTYDADTAPMCVREITDAIKARLKGRDDWVRYGTGQVQAGGASSDWGAARTGFSDVVSLLLGLQY